MVSAFSSFHPSRGTAGRSPDKVALRVPGPAPVGARGESGNVNLISNERLIEAPLLSRAPSSRLVLRPQSVPDSVNNAGSSANLFVLLYRCAARPQKFDRGLKKRKDSSLNHSPQQTCYYLFVFSFV